MTAHHELGGVLARAVDQDRKVLGDHLERIENGLADSRRTSGAVGRWLRGLYRALRRHPRNGT